MGKAFGLVFSVNMESVIHVKIWEPGILGTGKGPESRGFSILEK